VKIIKVAKAGKILDQPKGKDPSGKLDTQIFLGKKDPSKKKKKKECTSCSLDHEEYDDLVKK
jgi:hypothetical protein